MKMLARIASTLCLGLMVHGTVRADENSKVVRLREEITALIGPATCANLVNCRIAALVQ